MCSLATCTKMKNIYIYLHISVFQFIHNQHSFMFWRWSVLLFWAADYWQRKCRQTQVGSRGCDASRDNRWWLMLFWVKMKTTLSWTNLISDHLHVAPVAVERTSQAQQSIHNYSNWIIIHSLLINQEAIDALLQQNDRRGRVAVIPSHHYHHRWGSFTSSNLWKLNNKHTKSLWLINKNKQNSENLPPC